MIDMHSVGSLLGCLLGSLYVFLDYVHSLSYGNVCLTHSLVNQILNLVSPELVGVGDKIVLVNAAGDSAMGAQNDKKRDVVAITVADNVASLTADVVIITLEAGSQEGTFALKVADGYLAYANNGNAISTQETVDDAASWTITITDGVVSIQNVAYAERFLQYNISAPRFVCYKGTQEAPVIYKVEE